MAEHSQAKSILATLVVLLGVGIVLFFFFQPWIEVKLLVKSLKYSGMGLADKSTAILLVPLLGITTGIAIVMFLVRKQAKFRLIAMIVSLLGLLFVILVFVQINSDVKCRNSKDGNDLWQTWFWSARAMLRNARIFRISRGPTARAVFGRRDGVGRWPPAIWRAFRAARAIAS